MPNSELHNNYIDKLRSLLDSHKDITKVGFALDIQSIPEHYSEKKKGINWEQQFWTKELKNNTYKALIDTTFALYPSRYKFINKGEILPAIRVAGNFTPKHGGWYIDNKNLSDEDKFYFNSIDSQSSSWALNSDGQFADHDKYN